MNEVENIKIFLAEFEKEFLKKELMANHTTVVYAIDPDILTIADIYIICDLANLKLLGIELQRYPLVYAYISRYFTDAIFMSAHSQFLLFCETKAHNIEKNFAFSEIQKRQEQQGKKKKETKQD